MEAAGHPEHYPESYPEPFPQELCPAQQGLSAAADLSALSDEMLVRLIRQPSAQPSGEEYSINAQFYNAYFEELVGRFQKTVAGAASAYAGNPADAEDFAQEGLLGLLAAVSSYDERREAGFRTYAAVCIRNRIRSAARSLAAGKDPSREVTLTEQLDISDMADSLADCADTPEQVFFEKERVSELYAQISAVLSKQELEIFCLSASGFSYGEIAQRLQISAKSVDNAIQRARRKLRAVRSGYSK